MVEEARQRQFGSPVGGRLVGALHEGLTHEQDIAELDFLLDT